MLTDWLTEWGMLRVRLARVHTPSSPVRERERERKREREREWKRGRERDVELSRIVKSGNTKGGSITAPLTSCLTGLDQSVLQIKTKIGSCHTVDSKPVKQEVNGTVILPPFSYFSYRVFNNLTNRFLSRWGPGRNKVQDGLPLRRRRDVHHLRGLRDDPSDPGQLRPVLHRHLQQARLHRLECQLHVPQDDQGPAKQVRFSPESGTILITLLFTPNLRNGYSKVECLSLERHSYVV